MSISVYIKRHPLLNYYTLTFAISWGGILLVIGGPSGIPGTMEQFETLLPFVILALEAGPSVAGLLLTGLVYGRTGLCEVLSRLLRWRVGARWYAVALLTAPLLMTAIPLVLSLLFPEFLPGIITTDDKAFLLLMGIAAGLVAGVFEELGWTGFAIPRLRRQSLRSALTDTLTAFSPFLCRDTAVLQGAHGVGLRPYRELARGDAHARESHHQ